MEKNNLSELFRVINVFRLKNLLFFSNFSCNFVACYPMSFFIFTPLRNFFSTLGFCNGASRAKTTTRGWIRRTGHIPLENDSFPFLLLFRIMDGYCSKKCLSIGMKGISIKRLTAGQFNHHPQIHDCHPIGNMPDHA